MSEVLGRLRAPLAVLAIVGVGFGGGRVANGLIEGDSGSNSSPEPEICLIPIAGQMAGIIKDSRETETPVCDARPEQPVVIHIPKSLLSPPAIPSFPKN